MTTRDFLIILEWMYKDKQHHNLQTFKLHSFYGPLLFLFLFF